MRGEDATPTWTLVLPVKNAEQAKSRLLTPHGVDRVALARAIALDSLAAVLACPAVTRLVVVTSDPVVAAVVDRQAHDRADVVPDPGAGLHAAIHAGLRRSRPAGGPARVGVLLPDVPALRADDLSTALDTCARHLMAFVPDLEGTGTVLLTGAGEVGLRPAFGPASAVLHEQGGAVRLGLDSPRLRRDVDTWPALQQVLGLGAGPATRAAVAGHEPSPVTLRPPG